MLRRGFRCARVEALQLGSSEAARCNNCCVISPAAWTFNYAHATRWSFYVVKQGNKL